MGLPASTSNPLLVNEALAMTVAAMALRRVTAEARNFIVIKSG